MSWKCFPPYSVFVFYKIPSWVSGLFKNTWSLQTMWKGREHFCVLCFLGFKYFLFSFKIFTLQFCFLLVQFGYFGQTKWANINRIFKRRLLEDCCQPPHWIPPEEQCIWFDPARARRRSAMSWRRFRISSLSIITTLVWGCLLGHQHQNGSVLKRASSPAVQFRYPCSH